MGLQTYNTHMTKIDKTDLRWLLISLTVLAAGAAWIWISAVPAGTTTAGRIPAPRQGFLAPDFTLETADGQTFTMSELRGKPVLINLWTSWCPPCKAEMPALQRAYQRYHSEDLVILGINATNQDSQVAALNFAAENGLSFPILMDTAGEVSAIYQLRSLPTSYFVDHEGIIQEVVVGGPMSEALIRIKVEKLLD